ncbi:Hypothetical protein DEACI_3389 [Acididesulfobacillus acetoxydans]|uniref:Uncharacterized protein n=1 Tax=Acididesulfobacillus acetoxydans TaxID=1561005 RepID=A0A8S0X6N8_9FIRM|nr:Hypothetical protein DEACI_3389 [Acididesulfobacillus acetoxydans]CEJ06433.1 Hypothetical protein DEACI_0881 [Acididesulfobacillus acetoxydans]
MVAEENLGERRGTGRNSAARQADLRLLICDFRLSSKRKANPEGKFLTWGRKRDDPKGKAACFIQ